MLVSPWTLIGSGGYTVPFSEARVLLVARDTCDFMSSGLPTLLPVRERALGDYDAREKVELKRRHKNISYVLLAHRLSVHYHHLFPEKSGAKPWRELSSEGL